MPEHEGQGEILDKTQDNIIKMLITCDMNTGNVSVACDRMKDKILVYGILHCAEIAVMQAQLSAQPKLAIPHGIMDFVKRKRF